jgi:hypothetical protein
VTGACPGCPNSGNSWHSCSDFCWRKFGATIPAADAVRAQLEACRRPPPSPPMYQIHSKFTANSPPAPLISPPTAGVCGVRGDAGKAAALRPLQGGRVLRPPLPEGALEAAQAPVR